MFVSYSLLSTKSNARDESMVDISISYLKMNEKKKRIEETEQNHKIARTLRHFNVPIDFVEL